MSLRIYLILLTVIVIVILGWQMTHIDTKQKLRTSYLPRLLVEGNKIIRSDTNEIVILRGVVTDYFRFGRFNKGIRELGLKMELERLKDLKKAGGNLVGLYLSDTNTIIEKIKDLDDYIDFAEKQKIYVYLMPVERDFNGKIDAGDGSSGTRKDLRYLLDFISLRYANHVNVMFGLGAEPENKDSVSWHTDQLNLASIVKFNSRDSIIIVTGASYYPSSLLQYIETPFPYTNVIYLGGGYASKNDKDAKNNQERVNSKIEDATGRLLAQKHPYIAGEFGGNYGGDFSSSNDLLIIKSMLNKLNKNKTHYTMYKLSSSAPIDGLALFDTQGVITNRGKVFIESLRQFPSTNFDDKI